MGPPKFFDVSLPACHGLRTPADLHLLATTDVRVLPSGALNPSASATSHFEAVPALQGARSPLQPTGCSVDASPILFAVFLPTTPPWTQDSRRVVGSPLPDRDFHPARDAKLSWRDNARASGAAESGSEARADAVSRRLHAMVETVEKRLFVRALLLTSVGITSCWGHRPTTSAGSARASKPS